METCEPTDTPMVEKSKLDKDPKGKAVDPTRYHGMIVTLLYLTASRPDLVFVVCMCARYQAKAYECTFIAVFNDLLIPTWKPLIWSINWQTSSPRERLEFLIKRLGMQSMSPEDSEKLNDEVEGVMVRISSTNVRLETTVPQKEETFQVVTDLVKNSSCFKDFTISIDVPEIFMQYVSLERQQAITNYVTPELTYYGGMFHIENVDYPELIWEYLAYQIDHRKEKRSRHENMPFPQFTKIPPRRGEAKVYKERELLNGHLWKTVDVSKESEPEPESVKRNTSGKRRVKKKVTLSSDDNIIFDDPDTALELGKSISKTKVEEVEAARQGCSISYSRKNKRCIPLAALRKARRLARDSKGSEQESEYSEEDKLDDEEKDDKEGDADDEDDETESDEDDIYKYKTRADAEKTPEVDDDPKKTELPPTSSSLSVSLGFGDQFLKLSSDSSLVSTVKDTIDAEINSLLEVKIQSESSHNSPHHMLNIPLGLTFQNQLKKTNTDSYSEIFSKVNYLVTQETDNKTVVSESEIKKTSLEILKMKKEQAEKQNMLKFTIKSTDKAALKEYDQKSAIY
ncbi:hypothetical protein Tco_0317156 [Tanacetum coccineum]